MSDVTQTNEDFVEVHGVVDIKVICNKTGEVLKTYSGNNTDTIAAKMIMGLPYYYVYFGFVWDDLEAKWGDDISRCSKTCWNKYSDIYGGQGGGSQYFSQNGNIYTYNFTYTNTQSSPKSMYGLMSYANYITNDTMRNVFTTSNNVLTLFYIKPAFEIPADSTAVGTYTITYDKSAPILSDSSVSTYSYSTQNGIIKVENVSPSTRNYKYTRTFVKTTRYIGVDFSDTNMQSIIEANIISSLSNKKVFSTNSNIVGELYYHITSSGYPNGAKALRYIKTDTLTSTCRYITTDTQSYNGLYDGLPVYTIGNKSGTKSYRQKYNRDDRSSLHRGGIYPSYPYKYDFDDVTIQDFGSYDSNGIYNVDTSITGIEVYPWKYNLPRTLSKEYLTKSGKGMSFFGKPHSFMGLPYRTDASGYYKLMCPFYLYWGSNTPTLTVHITSPHYQMGYNQSMWPKFYFNGVVITPLEMPTYIASNSSYITGTLGTDGYYIFQFTFSIPSTSPGSGLFYIVFPGTYYQYYPSVTLSGNDFWMYVAHTFPFVDLTNSQITSNWISWSEFTHNGTYYNNPGSLTINSSFDKFQLNSDKKISNRQCWITLKESEKDKLVGHIKSGVIENMYLNPLGFGNYTCFIQNYVMCESVPVPISISATNSWNDCPGQVFDASSIVYQELGNHKYIIQGVHYDVSNRVIKPIKGLDFIACGGTPTFLLLFAYITGGSDNVYKMYWSYANQLDDSTGFTTYYLPGTDEEKIINYNTTVRPIEYLESLTVSFSNDTIFSKKQDSEGEFLTIPVNESNELLVIDKLEKWEVRKVTNIAGNKFMKSVDVGADSLVSSNINTPDLDISELNAPVSMSIRVPSTNTSPNFLSGRKVLTYVCTVSDIESNMSKICLSIPKSLTVSGTTYLTRVDNLYVTDGFRMIDWNYNSTFDKSYTSTNRMNINPLSYETISDGWRVILDGNTIRKSVNNFGTFVVYAYVDASPESSVYPYYVDIEYWNTTNSLASGEYCERITLPYSISKNAKIMDNASSGSIDFSFIDDFNFSRNDTGSNQIIVKLPTISTATTSSKSVDYFLYDLTFTGSISNRYVQSVKGYELYKCDISTYTCASPSNGVSRTVSGTGDMLDIYNVDTFSRGMWGSKWYQAISSDFLSYKYGTETVSNYITPTTLRLKIEKDTVTHSSPIQNMFAVVINSDRKAYTQNAGLSTSLSVTDTVSSVSTPILLISTDTLNSAKPFVMDVVSKGRSNISMFVSSTKSSSSNMPVPIYANYASGNDFIYEHMNVSSYTYNPMGSEPTTIQNPSIRMSYNRSIQGVKPLSKYVRDTWTVSNTNEFYGNRIGIYDTFNIYNLVVWYANPFIRVKDVVKVGKYNTASHMTTLRYGKQGVSDLVDIRSQSDTPSEYFITMTEDQKPIWMVPNMRGFWLKNYEKNLPFFTWKGSVSPIKVKSYYLDALTDFESDVFAKHKTSIGPLEDKSSSTLKYYVGYPLPPQHDGTTSSCIIDVTHVREVLGDQWSIQNENMSTSTFSFISNSTTSVISGDAVSATPTNRILIRYNWVKTDNGVVNHLQCVAHPDTYYSTKFISYTYVPWNSTKVPYIFDTKWVNPSIQSDYYGDDKSLLLISHGFYNNYDNNACWNLSIMMELGYALSQYNDVSSVGNATSLHRGTYAYVPAPYITKLSQATYWSGISSIAQASRNMTVFTFTKQTTDQHTTTVSNVDGFYTPYAEYSMGSNISTGMSELIIQKSAIDLNKVDFFGDFEIIHDYRYASMANLAGTTYYKDIYTIIKITNATKNTTTYFGIKSNTNIIIEIPSSRLTDKAWIRENLVSNLETLQPYNKLLSILEEDLLTDDIKYQICFKYIFDCTTNVTIYNQSILYFYGISAYIEFNDETLYKSIPWAYYKSATDSLTDNNADVDIDSVIIYPTISTWYTIVHDNLGTPSTISFDTTKAFCYPLSTDYTRVGYSFGLNDPTPW